MAWSDQAPVSRARGLAPEDRDFILARRASGQPDSAIARMLGKNLELVRSVETPPEIVARPRVQVFAPPPEPRPAPPPKPREWRLYVPRVVKMTIARIAEKHGLTPDHLIGLSRLAPIVRARQEAMHEIHQLGRFSLTAIGLYLGGRDHTTIIHGIRAHERRLDE